METKFVTTNLAMLTQFNSQDKSKSSLTRIGLFTAVEDIQKMNHLIRFDISKLGEDGKFSNSFVINMNVDKSSLMLKIEEILNRMSRMGKGETIESDPIIFHNGKNNITEATSLVTFDAYSNKDRGGMVILMKLEKKVDDKKERSIVYFGNSKNVYRFNKDNNDVTDLKSYAFFHKLKESLQGLISGTSLTNDLHYRRCVSAVNGEEYKKKGEESKSNDKGYDDDEMPF